jgi:hypothetical protein
MPEIFDQCFALCVSPRIVKKTFLRVLLLCSPAVAHRQFSGQNFQGFSQFEVAIGIWVSGSMGGSEPDEA